MRDSFQQIGRFSLTVRPRPSSLVAKNKTTDDYFLNSSSNVSFFLEEGAVDEDG